MPGLSSRATARFTLRSLLAFLCVGGAATLLHYALMALLVWAGVPVVPSSAIGFAVSSVLNYLLNERLTFRSNAPRRITAPRFLVVALSGLLLNHVLLTLLIAAGLPAVPAQLLTTTGVIVWNYCVHGAWTFRARRK